MPRPTSQAARIRLATALRILNSSAITADAEESTLSELARRAEALADDLSALTSRTGLLTVSNTVNDSDLSADASSLAARMPFDMIVGTANPIAPPMILTIDPPRALGRIEYTASFEGAPGCVHGAALAGAFDMILTAANVIAGAAGPTRQLTISYRKPTLISRPCIFEAWVSRIEGRRTFSQGRLLQGDVITVEAEGEFISVGRSRIAAMHRRDEDVTGVE